MRNVKVYSGLSIQDRCGNQKHPVSEVLKANEIINKVKLEDSQEVVYSNSTDFVSAIKYIGLRENIETEFFLDGVSYGNDIEPLFASFNKSFDLINQLGATEE